MAEPLTRAQADVVQRVLHSVLRRLASTKTDLASAAQDIDDINSEVLGILTFLGLPHPTARPRA
jgi:hypothetical protein